MEFLRKKYEQYTRDVISVTKIYEKHVTDYKFMPAVASYVYFMKIYFEIKYQFEINQFKKDNGIKIDLEHVDTLYKNIERAATALNVAFKKIDEKYVIGGDEARSEIKIGGSMDNPVTTPQLFYKKYKTKILSWTERTPRDKIIRTLESWFGISGEDSVLYTLYQMQSDANVLFDHVLSLYGYKSITNMGINRMYNTILNRLIKYYITHRDRYISDVSETRQIKIKNDINRVVLHDQFINIRIKFTECSFSHMLSSFKSLIEAIGKVDLYAAQNVVNIEPVDMGDDIYIRRDLKHRIIAIVEDIIEDAACVDVTPLSLTISRKNDIASIIEMTKKFVQLEKAAEREIENIKEIAQLQVQNIQRLESELEELWGPSISPCIKRVLPGIRFVLDSTDGNYTKKGGISISGEKLIKSIIM